MRAYSHQAAFVQEQNPIRFADDGQPVVHDEQSLFLNDGGKGLEDGR